jgi:hypothetical protein
MDHHPLQRTNHRARLSVARGAALLALAALLGPSSDGWSRRRAKEHLERGQARRIRASEPEVQVGRFLASPRLPRGGRASGRPGDYYLKGRHLLAVVRSDGGGLTDLAPGPDFVDRLGWGKVQVCDSNGNHPVLLRRVDIQTRRGYQAIVTRGVVLGTEGRLEVDTTYRVPRGARHLELVTRLKNIDPRRTRYNVGVCDELYAGNTPLVVPGLGEARAAGSHPARFVGRVERGVATLLAVPAGSAPMVLRLAYWHAAFDPAFDAAHPRANLEPGQQQVVRRVVVMVKGPLHRALAEGLRATGAPVRKVEIKLPANTPPGARLSVRRDGKPLLVTAVKQGSDVVKLALPKKKGRLSVALWLPGPGEGPHLLVPPDDKVEVVAPPSGELSLKVTVDKEQGVPVKLTIAGEGKTETPDFGRVGLRVGGVVYSEKGDERLRLRPGRYRVLASRGPDYSLARRVVKVQKGRPVAVKLRLRRMVPSRGWLAADLHLHSSESFDSPVAAADQVVVAATRGLDLVVLTDHDAVTGYQPPKDVVVPLVMPGQEVTTSGHQFGHFNVFPLEPGAALESRRTTPRRLFRAARRRKALIQVNHPRMGSIGYFDQMGLDAKSGRARVPGYASGFDLLEVFNGDHLESPREVKRMLEDWFALLETGKRYVATGGSDAHRPPHQEPGYPRTCILWREANTKKGEPGFPTPERVLGALRRGRAFVTTGPRLFLTVDGKPTGATVKPRAGKPLSLRLRVEAAPWVDVRKVELWERGKLARTIEVKGRGVLRLDRTLKLDPPPRRDTWFVAIARGEKPDPTVSRKVLPFAVTNPMWVDADGDGKLGFQ